MTLYVAHILIGMGILETYGLLDGSLGTHQIFIVSVVFCAASLVYAYLWRMVASRGPLESLMRYLCG
ncbi:MAG: DUF418 domain-containing protein [Paracoccaceae bacterium]